MAANSEQGKYVGTTLVGFTAFPAGLVMGSGAGVIISVVGLVLLAFSAVGFYRIKSLEFTK